MAAKFLFGLSLGSFVYNYYNALEFKKQSGYYYNSITSKVIDGKALMRPADDGADENNTGRSILANMNTEQYKKFIAGKTFELTGVIDHSKEILVPSTKNGYPGYYLFVPIYTREHYEWMHAFSEVHVDGGVYDRMERSKGAYCLNLGWSLNN